MHIYIHTHVMIGRRTEVRTGLVGLVLLGRGALPPAPLDACRALAIIIIIIIITIFILMFNFFVFVFSLFVFSL